MIIKYGLRAIILGLLLALCMARYDQWISDRVGPWVCASFERLGACTMQVGSTSCTLLSPSVIFEDVIVTSCGQQAWNWSAKRYTIAFSWLHLVLYGMIDMHITLEGLRADSQMQANIPDIFSHVIGLMSGEQYLIPTFITSLTLDDAQLTMHDAVANREAFFTWKSTINHAGNCVKVLAQIRDGAVSYDGKTLVNTVHGPVELNIPTSGGLSESSITGSCSMQAPLLPPCARSLHAFGSWHEKKAKLSLSTDTQQAAVELTDFKREGALWQASFSGRMPLSDLTALYAPVITSTHDATVHGVVSTDGTHHAMTITTACAALDISGYKVPDLIYCAQLSMLDGQLKGVGTLASECYGTLHGTVDWDTNQQQGECSFTTESACAIPMARAWCVQPHDCVVRMVFGKTGITIKATCTATHSGTGVRETLLGSMALHEGTFTASGSHTVGNIECSGSYLPAFGITRAVFTDAHNKQVIRALTRRNHADILRAIIDVPFVRAVCKTLWGYDIQGDGVLALDVKLGQKIAARIMLSESSIRLPGTYNFIRSSNVLCAYDIAQSLFMIKQGVYQLDRGVVRTDGAQIMFNQEGHIMSFYIPVVAQQCMVTFDRGVFALLSGYIQVRKDGQPLHLSGHVLIDQAHLEGNIFSHMFQRSVATCARDFLLREYTDNCLCDLTCESLQPVSIKTAFLETHAHVAMKVTGALSSPAITGNMTLVGGSFFFPYKPLYITRGSIYFDEHQPQDSLVEVVASNKIKKYDVTMQISGSLLNNSVNLLSSPPLSEEQILSLLLIGSQEESLNMVMPALIMQNLTSLIFNQVQSPTELESFFGRLLKPFEYIRFIPSFADQSGRGGLRGALEIEITDRLRAMIQKNFSLLEDTRFEIEYAVSDDITVRGMRNERRDVGGEVEVRWKF